MKIKYLKFRKDSLGKWFVVLPEYTGPKDDLEMVQGADNLCEILAQGEDEVEVAICNQYFKSDFALTLLSHENDGGWYRVHHKYFNFDIWLCKVTKFVFGDLPENIYLS